MASVLKYLLFVFFISPCLLTAQQDKVSHWYDLYSKGEFQQLESSITSELAASNKKLTKAEHISGLVLLSRLRTNEKRYQEALGYLINAKQLNPKNLEQYAKLYNEAFANFFHEIGGLNLSIRYFKECLRLSHDNYQRYYYLGAIGSCYQQISNSQKAIDYFSRQNALAIQSGNMLQISSSYNNLGYSYYQQKDYHRAKENYLKALKILNASKSNGKSNAHFDEGFYSLVLDNLGITCYALKEYRAASGYLNEAFGGRKRFCLSYPNENIKGEVLLVSSLLKTGRLNDARLIVTQFEKHAANMADNKRLQFIDMKAEVCLRDNNYAVLEELLQERRTVTERIESEKKIKQSALSDLLSQYMVASYTQQLKQEKIQKEQLKKDNELQENKTIIISVLWVISCATFILMLVIAHQIGKNRQRKYKLEKELQAIEDERIRLKLKAQENSLTDLALEVLQKRETSNDLVQKMSSLLNEGDEKIKTELLSILREVKMSEQSTITKQSEDPDELIQLKEFQERLRAINPDISKSEMELSTLVRMNLSNKEIAAIKNYTENTIKTGKHRLKKKFGLNANDSLTRFIREV